MSCCHEQVGDLVCTLGSADGGSSGSVAFTCRDEMVFLLGSQGRNPRGCCRCGPSRCMFERGCRIPRQRRGLAWGVFVLFVVALVRRCGVVVGGWWGGAGLFVRAASWVLGVCSVCSVV